MNSPKQVLEEKKKKPNLSPKLDFTCPQTQNLPHTQNRLLTDACMDLVELGGEVNWSSDKNTNKYLWSNFFICKKLETLLEKKSN